MTPPLKVRKTIPVLEDTTLVLTTVRMTLENPNFAGRRQDNRVHDEGEAFRCPSTHYCAKNAAVVLFF
jgi:hypothetical protein